MTELEHEGPELARIHSRNNEKKLFCHFTGFLEGIVSSGRLETGEVEPLVAECTEFFEKVTDLDASDILQDFDAELLEHCSIADVVQVRLQDFEEGCTKSQVNRFLGFCRGVVADGIVTVKEAEAILNLVSKMPDLQLTVGVKQIIVSCEDALEDGVVSDAESAEICEAIGQIVGDSFSDTGLAQTTGVANYSEHRLTDISVDFDRRSVVLTGSFRTSPRRLFEEELIALGANVSRSVSNKTDFLIIGGEASRDWIEMNRGTKMIKAQKIRLTSDRPAFVSEGQILLLMQT